ncbi:protein of unknown function [Rhodovastum atsumiense]|nr:protein of unknown function [Rhodovastum atsumiense]
MGCRHLPTARGRCGCISVDGDTAVRIRPYHRTRRLAACRGVARGDQAAGCQSQLSKILDVCASFFLVFVTERANLTWGILRPQWVRVSVRDARRTQAGAFFVPGADGKCSGILVSRCEPDAATVCLQVHGRGR